MSNTLSEQLLRWSGELPFSLPPQADKKLLDFISLLDKWNQAYNLTAVRQPTQMITRHLMDSLVVVPYLHGEQILDVGSGPGLPGIPLALACPERQFTLLDSNVKKVRFLRQAVAELRLENVSVVHSRVEQFQSSPGFDTIIARAYATLGELVWGAHHLCRPGGLFLAMKGVKPVAELDDLPENFELEAIHPLHVPGLEAERHLLVVRHVAGRH